MDTLTAPATGVLPIHAITTGAHPLPDIKHPQSRERGYSAHLRRILLYSHDTYGLGHLRRNLAIAGHLLRTIDQLQVVLVSGSPVASRFSLPRGLQIVSLPPVVKVAPEAYNARDNEIGFGVVSRARAAIIADVARRFRPDVLLVDHAPLGMKGELLPTFETLRRDVPGARIVLGLRDVLDDPDDVRRAWDAEGILARIEQVYDRILVYGSPDILDAASAYGIVGSARERVSYCGYISRVDERPLAFPRPVAPSGARYVLGTAGGGEDGFEALLATVQAATALDLDALIVAGPLMHREGRERLVADAAKAGGRVQVVDFVPDMDEAMAGASAIVTMGGYNTLCEAVASGVPTVVIPRTWPRREQAIRARLFEERGLVRVVEPGDDLAGRLAPRLREALGDRRRLVPGIDLHGARRVREALLGEAAAAARQRASVSGRASLAAPSLATA